MNIILIKTLQLLLCLSLLVVLHEGGHFGFAKLFKTRVTRFYMFANYGFHLFSTYDDWFRRLLGKPLITKRGKEGQNFPQWLRNQWYRLTGQKNKIRTEGIGNKEYDPEAGTEYGIGWLPIGGYVAIAGMIDETNKKLEGEAKPWEFRSKKVWQRFLIMVGGVLMNFVTAIVIYCGIMFFVGEDRLPMQHIREGFAFNLDAEQVGFRDGDIPVEIDGEPILGYGGHLLQDLSNAETVVVLRQGQRQTLTMPEGGLNLLQMVNTQPRFMEMLIPAVVDSVLKDAPAARAGMMKGTRILAVDGTAITTKNEFDSLFLRRTDVLSMKDCSHADSLRMRRMTLVFQNPEAPQPDTVDLRLTEEYMLGLVWKIPYTKDDYEHISYGLLASIPAGVKYGWKTLVSYVDQLKYIPTKEGVQGVGSFVAIGDMFPETWDWLRFWSMTALLSIVLAVMNILPIPGLDGGHVVILLYEAVTGRQPSERVMVWLEYIGMACLIALMVLAFGNDLRRIVLPWLFK